jgi:hypothetical protein
VIILGWTVIDVSKAINDGKLLIPAHYWEHFWDMPAPKPVTSASPGTIGNPIRVHNQAEADAVKSGRLGPRCGQCTETQEMKTAINIANWLVVGPLLAMPVLMLTLYIWSTAAEMTRPKYRLYNFGEVQKQYPNWTIDQINQECIRRILATD